MIRSARDEVSACASVFAATKSTPEKPETIMLLTALPPAHTNDAELQFPQLGGLQIIGITLPLSLGVGRRRFLPLWSKGWLVRESLFSQRQPVMHVPLPQACRCVELESRSNSRHEQSTHLS